MHGHGPVPHSPRPSTALLVVVRVVLVALSVFSLGLFAWAAMLRIAVLRRRRPDWLLFWGALLLAVAAFVVLGAFGADTGDQGEPETGPLDAVCAVVLLGLAFGVPVHYLIAEISHYQEPRAPGGWPAAPGQAASPYGTPPPTAGPYPRPGPRPPSQPGPYAGPDRAAPPYRPPSGPAPGTGYGYPPAPAAPPAPPAAPPGPGVPGAPAAPGAGTPRIDQVRAELDELSDLLRGPDHGDRPGEGSTPGNGGGR
ncbi:hypothetical protein [Streptomyces sp. NPDC048001]|uniref:hypothetical protein n=1 Tax=Streptomyces sp. NPDC048001 TaxID=3365498 RepID=UPI00370F8867